MKNSSFTPKPPPFREYKKYVFKESIKVCSFIYQIGELDRLRKPSVKIPLSKITTKEYQEKIQYVKNSLIKYRKLTGKGRGIAAVQLGIPEQLIVTYIPEIRGKLLVVINPEIIESSKEFLRYPEMCMSANPIIAPVVRPSWIVFSYFDEQGRKQVWNTKDTTRINRMYNRVFQHEIDHLRGIINVDKVQSKELILESDPEFYERASFEKVKNNF